MRQEYIMVLLLRLCAVASLASILVRVGRFKTMLLREERTINQRFVLALCFAAIFASGVMIRLVAPSYRAVDLGLEGSLLAGLVSSSPAWARRAEATTTPTPPRSSRRDYGPGVPPSAARRSAWCRPSPRSS